MPDLADLFWQALDPESWNASKADAFQRNNLGKVKNDKNPGYSGIEERVATKAPGLLDAIFARDDLANAALNNPPQTGEDIANELRQMIIERRQNNLRVKSDI